MDEDTRFRNAIAKSWAAVWAVGAYIHRRGGFAIEIGPLRIRPNQDNRAGYGDNADLIVREISRDLRYPVEVKWRDFEFHDASDYPYSTIFIDRADKNTKARAYFIVNKTLTYAAKIDASTRRDWIGPKTYFDSKKGYHFNVYECPREAATFVELQQI